MKTRTTEDRALELRDACEMLCESLADDLTLDPDAPLTDLYVLVATLELHRTVADIVYYVVSYDNGLQQLLDEHGTGILEPLELFVVAMTADVSADVAA